MNLKNIGVLLFWCFLFLGKQGAAQFYTGSNHEFGKSRVQYRDFNWLVYGNDKIEVYYYQNGKNIAAYGLRSGLKSLTDIQRFYDYSISEQIQMIVYNKQSEFRQSNVGLQIDDAVQIGGTTQIVGSKLFVYYEDSHEAFQQNIREGLSEIIFNQLMYGGDWKESLKSNTLLSIPGWFKSGLISFSVESWNEEVDSAVRDGILSGKYKRINQVSGQQAKYAGHAIWKYVADVYGENVIPNILYMTRISRNVENGFQFVLGVSLDVLMADFLNYYQKRFEGEKRIHDLPQTKTLFTTKQLAEMSTWETLSEKNLEKKEAKLAKKQRKQMGALALKFKKKYDYTNFELSPLGDKIAFTTDELGQYKIFIYDIASGKNTRILKREYKLQRIQDDTYPIIKWHPTGQFLTYVYEDKSDVWMGNYNLEEKESTEKQLFRIEKVVDMAYSHTGTKMIFSGVLKGQTDLFEYDVLGNFQNQLTNDIYDDLNPKYLNDKNQVIFSSNRPDDTLRTDVHPNLLFNLEKDIFVMDVPSKRLTQITDTPDADEHTPAAYDNKNFTFLSDQKGITNRFLGQLDSAISRVDTVIHYRYFTRLSALSDYGAQPVEHQFYPKSGQYLTLFQKGGRPYLLVDNRSSDLVMNNGILDGSGGQSAGGTTNSNLGNVEVTLYPKNEDEKEIDIKEYTFLDDELNYTFEKETIELSESTPIVPDSLTESLYDFKLSGGKNYRLNFVKSEVEYKVDNSFNTPFYQPYSGPNASFPGLSGLFQVEATDLFEDYVLKGGLRVNSNLDNNDFGVSFKDLSGRLDKEYAFYKLGLRQDIDGFRLRQNTNFFSYRLSYPIHELLSIRGSLIYRNDRNVFLADDYSTLALPNENEHMAGAKLEYVFDSTLPIGLNLMTGTRYKIFGEYYQEPGEKNSDFMVFGFDFRHYERIHREIIFAVRFSGSTSLGSKKLAYFMGGLDNWIFNRVDNSVPIDETQNYAYQTIATPLRSFYVNTRNGNSFGLVNLELRVPVFKYFARKPIKNDFLENFQIVPFFDVGSAWTGKHPYTEENTFNEQEYVLNPVSVTIKSNREPVVFSYGAGIRSRLLGYFFRLDYGWGVDDQTRLPGRLQLSFSYDF